jgi:5-deoxy-glucuronate isomerase
MGKFSTELSAGEGMNQADLGSSDFKFIKEFGVLNFQRDSTQNFKASPHETGLLILEGSCELKIDGDTAKTVTSRDSIFSGIPSAAYIPIDTPFTIRSSKALIGLCRAACTEKTEPAIIEPDQVKVMNVGKDNWAREVRILIGPNAPSVNLIMGETINPPGNWSGTPPHKHEGINPEVESLHEELYYFKPDKPQGWGIERLYSSERGVNELIYLKDNTVTFMPWGYHQIVSGPGYTLYYMFFLAGKGKDLKGYEDQDHNWIK